MNDPVAQQRLQQFVELLPVTIAIAGLSRTDQGKYMTEEQMEIRMRTLLKAYKFAKLAVKEATSAD